MTQINLITVIKMERNRQENENTISLKVAYKPDLQRITLLLFWEWGESISFADIRGK